MNVYVTWTLTGSWTNSL